MLFETELQQAQPALRPLRKDKLAAVIPETWGYESEGLVRKTISFLAYFMARARDSGKPFVTIISSC